MLILVIIYYRIFKYIICNFVYSVGVNCAVVVVRHAYIYSVHKLIQIP